MWIDNIYFGYPFGGGFQNPNIVFGTSKRSYTIRVEEWLKTKHPELDPLDSDQMLHAGLDTIFKNMNLNVLSDQYKETFIIQFLNEFYMNEIGQETTDFFRQNLNRIIQNHGLYIKSLYEMAEKKYFIEYSTRITEGAHEEITNSEGTRSNLVNTTSSNEHSDTGLEEHSVSGNGKENASGTNNTDVTQNGEDSREQHRTNNETLSGSDALKHDTSDATAYGSNDTRTVTNMITETNYGKTDTFSYGPNGESVTRSGSEQDKHAMKHKKEGKEHTGGYDETSGTGTNGASMERQTEYNGSESTTDSFNGYNTHRETERTYDNYSILRNGKDTAVNKMSDTPQNGLQGMGFDEGTGDYGEGGGNYGDGYDTYMSEAQINTRVSGQKEAYNGSYKDTGDDTQNGSKISTRDFTNRNDVTTEYESRRTDTSRDTEFTGRYDEDDGTITKTYNDVKELHEGSHNNKLSGKDTQTVNGSEKNAKTGTDTVTHTGTDTTQYGRKADGKDDVNESGSSHVDSTSKNETSNERTTENSESGTRNTSASGTASGKTSSDGTETSMNNGKANGTNRQTEEHYSYNRDAVMMSNDITDKIWELFDDCFMQVL